MYYQLRHRSKERGLQENIECPIASLTTLRGISICGQIEHSELVLTEHSESSESVVDDLIGMFYQTVSGVHLF
jgi:hypothetical protein